MYYVLRFWTKCPKWGKPADAGVEGFAPLAGPATAGEKSEKLGIWKRVMLNHYPRTRSEL